MVQLALYQQGGGREYFFAVALSEVPVGGLSDSLHTVAQRFSSGVAYLLGFVCMSNRPPRKVRSNPNSAYSTRQPDAPIDK